MPQLIVDCQILQTAAYDRGMGKYTISLLEALVAQNKKTKRYGKVVLLFNKNLPKIKKHTGYIKKRIQGTEHVYLDLPINIAESLHEKYDTAKDVITKYIDANYKPSDLPDFLITAPFFVDFPAVFPRSDYVKKFTIVYDLTPQKIWFLQRIFPDDVYFKHFELFLQADHLMTISRAVKDDLTKLVGIPESKITSIDGAPFMNGNSDKSSANLKLKKPYILLPTAPIVHKNNENAVRGFTNFNNNNNNRYTLYITSSFDQSSKDKLLSINPGVQFTGNITDSQLAKAYVSASAVLFPSLAEGLGMPVLEAALYGTPVACSDIPVLKELSEDGFYYFDPRDNLSIANSLSRAVGKKDWPEHQVAYKDLEKKYTWERSADILMRTMRLNYEKIFKRKSLHLVIPNPSGNSPAAYLGEQLYASLASRYSLTLEFVTSKKPDRPSYVSFIPTQEAPGDAVVIKSERRSIKDIIKKSYPVTITYGGLSRPFKLSLCAKTVITDRALDLTGWEYYVRNVERIEIQGILKLIMKKGI
jgi:glycosyltransferase involved in cell wall biosynthesis